MNIFFDGDGYVVLDKTYDQENIDNITDYVNNEVSALKPFDPTQIQALWDKINIIYPIAKTFDEIIDNWGWARGEI